MLKLKVEQILKAQNRSKYWLWKQMKGMSYQNFNRLCRGETKAISFEKLELLHMLLGVSFDELFEVEKTV